MIGKMTKNDCETEKKKRIEAAKNHKGDCTTLGGDEQKIKCEIHKQQEGRKSRGDCYVSNEVVAKELTTDECKTKKETMGKEARYKYSFITI